MNKVIKIIVVVVSLFLIGGCLENARVDGIILGAVYLDGEVETNTPFGQQSTKISGLMPMAGIIVKFGKTDSK